MRYVITAILLLFSVAAFGQLDQFRMVGSGSWSVVDDSTYSATVTFASDLTANSFLPTGVVDSMRVFTQRGQLYTIDSVGAKTFSTAVIYAVEYGGNWGSPSGQVLVYETRGRETVPAIPFATNGATSKLQEAVVTHNAAINNGVSTTQLADSTTAAKIYTNNQIASVAPVKDTIVQASHGFSVGDPIWYSGDYLLSLDTGLTVRVDGVISEVPDVNTFVLQRTGRFTLTAHGFSVGVQLYVQPDGSYSVSDTSNSLVYGYPIDVNTIEIGLNESDVFKLVEPRTFEFSKTSFNSTTRAKENNKTWVVSDTVVILGNLNVSDLDIIFEKNGFISGADTITANGATIQANPGKQLWSSSTVITGDWGNESGYLQWSIGSDISDSIANFRAFTNVIEMGAEVIVTFDSIEVATSSVANVYDTEKDIKIRGGKEYKSRVILVTKHNPQYSYLRSDEGNNVFLKNISWETRDNLNGNHYNGIYHFYRSQYSVTFPNTAPKIESFVIEDCDFKGSILNVVFNDDDNQTLSEFQTNYLKEVRIQRVNIDKSEGFFSFSNIPYDNMLFDQITATNFKATVFFGAISGMATEFSEYSLLNRKNLTLSNSTFKNDTVFASTTNAFLAPIVSKGFDYSMYNCIVEGIKTSSNTTATYAFYMAAQGEMNVYNNTFRNYIGRLSGGFPLAYFKGSRKVKLNNNRFTVNKQSYVDIGLLDSLTQDLATLSGINTQLISDDIDGEVSKEWQIVGNTFQVPFANTLTRIDDVKDLQFTGNTIDVVYWGDEASSEPDGIFLYNKNRPDIEGENIISTGNTFNIKTFQSGIFRPIRNGGLTTSDSLRNFKTILVDDKIISDSVSVFYSVGDTDVFSLSVDLQGEGGVYTTNQPTTNTKTPVGKYIYNCTVNDFSSVNTDPNTSSRTTGLPLMNINSNTALRATTATTAIIELLTFRNNDALYHLSDSLPVSMTINFNYKSLDGKSHSDTYKVVIGDDQKKYFPLVGGGYWEDTGHTATTDTTQVNGVISGPVTFNLARNTGGLGKFLFLNCDSIQSFDISVKFKKFPTSVIADYKSFVDVNFSDSYVRSIGTSSTGANRVFFDENGNIGVGKTPGEDLDFKTNSTIKQTFNSSANQWAHQMLTDNGHSSGFYYINRDSRLYMRDDAGNLNVYIDSDGKSIFENDLELGGHGQSNKTPSTLSKTYSGFTAAYGNDGTFIEIPIEWGTKTGTTDASGDILVAHGLTSGGVGIAPDNVKITNLDTSGVRFFTVHSISTTNFTVRCYDSSGTALNAGSVDFQWEAKAKAE